MPIIWAEYDAVESWGGDGERNREREEGVERYSTYKHPHGAQFLYDE